MRRVAVPNQMGIRFEARKHKNVPVLHHRDDLMKDNGSHSAAAEDEGADPIRADLGHRGRARSNERCRVPMRCGCIIIPVKALFFFEEVEYPISVVLCPYMVKQERQFEMGMDINKTRHNDCLFQTDNTMAWIIPHHCGSITDSMDPAILYNDGPGNKRNAV